MTDPGPALTLGQMVDRSAERFPDREAVVFKGERVTYAELKRRADDFARGLLGLCCGCRTAWSGASPTWGSPRSAR
jgi:non-ribosomal peptide synthetase component E (peptide arylation enzyme)